MSHSGFILSQTRRHRFRCIAIHARKIHQRVFEQFWQGKVGISSSSGGKRPERVLAVPVMTRYGKSGEPFMPSLMRLDRGKYPD